MTAGTNRLAQLRREAGHTQQSLVEECRREAKRLGIPATFTVRTLRRWEREVPPPLPHPAQQAVLETVFGMPLAEMGFQVPAHRQHTPGPISDYEDVRRRQFVASSGGIAAAALLPDLPGRVGMADVRRFQVGLAELYDVDHRRGGIPAQARARELEQQITRSLANGVVTGLVGHALQTMACELACHRAWFAYDGGWARGELLDQARTACAEAITAAQLVDDRLLQVRALASLSLIAVEAGHGWEARSAVERARSLARDAGAGPTVHLVVALREANAAVHAGDLSTARRALSRATSHQARLDRDHEVPRWARFAGPVEVDYATAAWYRARLAEALLEAGEVEEACAEVTAVLDACGQVSSRRLRRRLGDVAAAAARTGAAVTHDPVDRIRDLLRAA